MVVWTMLVQYTFRQYRGHSLIISVGLLTHVTGKQAQLATQESTINP